MPKKRMSSAAASVELANSLSFRFATVTSRFLGTCFASSGFTDWSPKRTISEASARSKTRFSLSRTKKRRLASRAARRKSFSNAPVSTIVSTTDWTTGRPATRSVDPRSTRLTTISRLTTCAHLVVLEGLDRVVGEGIGVDDLGARVEQDAPGEDQEGPEDDQGDARRALALP